MGGVPILDGGRPLARLLGVPAVRGGDEPDKTLAAARVALLPALAQAHASGEPMLVAWVRPEPAASIQVLLGLDGGAPYPPGGLTEPVTAETAARALRGLPAWVRCAGGVDALTAPAPDGAPPLTFGFEECVTQLAGTPFAWLVVAEPVPDDQLRARLRELAYAVPRLRDRQATAESARIDLAQAEARYRELARAEATGLWDVHLLVGGAEPVSARRVAALLCRAAAVAPLPYAARPFPEAGGDLDKAWLATGAAGTLSAPFAAHGEVLAALARPPQRELPGVRVIRPSTFDVTPELAAGGTELALGSVLDRALQPAGEFRVSTDTVNRHVFVCGATGAGKSQTVRSLLESLHGRGVPWLVIEPAKAEYAGMAGRLPEGADVLVIRPGDADAVPSSLNPLEPEAGFPLQTHIDLVRALFLAAFEPTEPFPQVLSRAIVRCYEELGWELALGEPRHRAVRPRYPTLGDLQRTARDVVSEIGYSDKIADDVRGFVDVRLGSLRLGTPGRFFEGGHPLDVAELLRRNVVLELEDIGNDQDKAFFIGTVLIRVVEHLRVRATRDRSARGLRHVTVIEEAHRLLRRVDDRNPAAHAVELFAGLLAEIRAYGEGIVVAEQIPAKILPDVVKNTALKIMHRLPAHDDRFAVGATMNLDEEQSQYVVTLPPGRAAVFADGMDRPVLVRMHARVEDEDPSGASRRTPLTRPAFAGCPPSCLDNPCAVRRMVAAAQVIRDEPGLSLWAELLTAAHVVGEAEPVPEASWLAGVRAVVEPAGLTCVAAQLGHEAVETRYRALVPYYRPEDLGAHVAGRLRAWLLGEDAQATRCTGDEISWQAGRFRWIDVMRVLSTSDPRSGPHPDTARWRERGLSLPQATVKEQFNALLAHPDVWVPHATAAIVGYDDPPRWDQAAKRLSYLPGEGERLQAAARFLSFSRNWLRRVLVQPPPAKAEDPPPG